MCLQLFVLPEISGLPPFVDGPLCLRASFNIFSIPSIVIPSNWASTVNNTVISSFATRLLASTHMQLIPTVISGSLEAWEVFAVSRMGL